MIAPPDTSFRWQDGERLILFGRGRVAEVGDAVGDGYVLMTTERAARAAPDLVDRARDVVHVGAGRVDELAAELRPRVGGELLVALGGGRVIDTAKALAAADGPRRVAAVPTTLSGAEMTRGHRQAADAPPGTAGVRPAVVVNDPALSASQPVPELAASGLNALGHAAEAPLSRLANPVATLVALEAARRLPGALGGDDPGSRAARDEAALGALLAGWAMDATLYGLHHVVSQTLVRLAGIGHGPANAVMLSHSLRALRWRFPAEIERLGEAMGGEASERAAELCARTGATRLRELGVEREALDACVEAAARRPELEHTPPRADPKELRTLYEAAW